jgi:hypothetical protein
MNQMSMYVQATFFGAGGTTGATLPAAVGLLETQVSKSACLVHDCHNGIPVATCLMTICKNIRWVCLKRRYETEKELLQLTQVTIFLHLGSNFTITTNQTATHLQYITD